MINKNKCFQWLWFKVFQKLIKVEGEGIEALYLRMIWQFRIAVLFGGVRAAVAGDSNGDALNFYEAMREFNEVTINISVGNTHAHHWLAWFQTSHGKEILKRIKDLNVILNVGGNYILHNKMELAKSGLEAIKALFPFSYNCTVPPIRSWILDLLDNNTPINKTKEQWDFEVETLNTFIRGIWGIQCIDLYYAFLDGGTQEAQFWAIKDIVHYSRLAAWIICNILKFL